MSFRLLCILFILRETTHQFYCYGQLKNRSSLRDDLCAPFFFKTLLKEHHNPRSSVVFSNIFSSYKYCFVPLCSAEQTAASWSPFTIKWWPQSVTSLFYVDAKHTQTQWSNHVWLSIAFVFHWKNVILHEGPSNVNGQSNSGWSVSSETQQGASILICSYYHCYYYYYCSIMN